MPRKKQKTEAISVKVGDEVMVSPGGFLGNRFGGKVISISDDGKKASLRLSDDSRDGSSIDNAVINVEDIDSINGRHVYKVLLGLQQPNVAPVPGLSDVVSVASECQAEGEDNATVAWVALGRLAFSAKQAHLSMLRSHVQIIQTAAAALAQAEAMDELRELATSMMYSAATQAEKRMRRDGAAKCSVEGDITPEQDALLRLRLLTMPLADLKQHLNKSGLAMIPRNIRTE